VPLPALEQKSLSRLDLLSCADAPVPSTRASAPASRGILLGPPASLAQDFGCTLPALASLGLLTPAKRLNLSKSKSCLQNSVCYTPILAMGVNNGFSFATPGLGHFLLTNTHGLRRGLHSSAAPQLSSVGRSPIPALKRHDTNSGAVGLHSCAASQLSKATITFRFAERVKALPFKARLSRFVRRG